MMFIVAWNVRDGLTVRHPFGRAAALILLAAIACHSRQPSLPPGGAQSDGQPQASRPFRLAELWEERRAGLDKLSKDYPRNKIAIMLSLLEQTPPEQVESEFKRIRSAPVAYERMSEYEQVFIQAFVTKTATQKDDEKLLHLLSAKCPRSVATSPIESYPTFKDADRILILFDAYQRSVDDANRKVILEALASAFKELRRRYRDDRKFVNATKRWYLANRHRLEVNADYRPHSSWSGTQNLFIPKARAARH